MKKLLISILSVALLFSLSVPTMADTGLTERRSTISAYWDYSAAILEDGSLWVWGGDVQLYETRPKRVMENVESVSTGANALAVIRSDHSLWRYNAFGTPHEESIKLADNVLSYQVVAPFNSFITTDHTLWRIETTWNNNMPERRLIKVMDDVVSAALTISGFTGSGYLVVKSDGSLWMWGNGYYGDGNDYREDIKSPVKIMDDVLEVHSQKNNYAALAKDGSLWIWNKENLTLPKYPDSLQST